MNALRSIIALSRASRMVPAVFILLLAPSVLLAQPERSKTSSYVKVRVRTERPVSTGEQKVQVVLEVDDNLILLGPELPSDLASSRFKIDVRQHGTPVRFNVAYPRGEIMKEPLLGDYSFYQREINIPLLVHRTHDGGPIELVISMLGQQKRYTH